MFGWLKERAKEKAMTTLGDKLASLKAEFEMFKRLKPSDIQIDDIYHKIVTKPLWEVFKAQSGGAITLAQKFIDVEGKFKDGLVNIRNELVKIEGEKVNLHPEFNQKVVPTLIASFKN